MVSLYNFMFITGELLIDFTEVKGQQPSYVFEKNKTKASFSGLTIATLVYFLVNITKQLNY